MKIYTKTGDEGMTSLFGGKRLSKAALRIDTYGTVDELNSWVGVLRDHDVNSRRKEVLLAIQLDFYNYQFLIVPSPFVRSKVPLNWKMHGVTRNRSWRRVHFVAITTFAFKDVAMPATCTRCSVGTD